MKGRINLGQIKFARVDDRLVHGQVTTAWSNSVGINSIYVVDDPTANDEFTKMLYTSLQNNYSFKIKVFTVDEVVNFWKETEFEKDKVLLLFKDVNHAFKVAEAGIPFDTLNVGGVAKKDYNEKVADAVALTKEELDKLNILLEEYDVNVFFQTLPSASKKKITEVKR